MEEDKGNGEEKGPICGSCEKGGGGEAGVIYCGLSILWERVYVCIDVPGGFGCHLLERQKAMSGTRIKV
jgi:hypothetical protein